MFEYSLYVDKDIIGLDINPRVDNNDILISIEGTDNLKPGVNLVKITLTSKDDSNVKTVYTITVNKEKVQEDVTKTDGEVTQNKKASVLKGPKGILMIVIGIIIILTIALITLIIIDNKNKKKVQKDNGENIGKSKKNKEEYNVFDSKEREETEDDSKTTKGKGRRFNKKN